MPNRTPARQQPRREVGHRSPQRTGEPVERGADETPATGTSPDRQLRRRRSSRTLRRRRYRGWVVALLLFAVLGILVLLGVAAAVAYPARAELIAGRDAMVAGRRAVTNGDAAAASRAFERGRQAFGNAEQTLTAGPVRAARALPIAGRSFTAVHDLATAGHLLGGAALEVSEGLSRLPEGALTLAPDDGVIPLDSVEAMQPVLRAALESVNKADALMAATPQSMIARPVRDAQSELMDQLQAGDEALTTAEALARTLPPFLGADGPRRYFFGAATPAEVRGTGGLIGAYAILTVDDGDLQLSEFYPHNRLPVLPAGDVQTPNDDYARRYNRFGGAGILVNINMTPDFPSAAVAIRNLYEAHTDEQLDGVIVADPVALQGLLELTGPANVPGVGRVDANTVVPYLSNQAYETFDDSTERKSVLGDVASAVLGRFLEGDIDAAPAEVLRTLGTVVGQRRLQFYATADAVQEGLDTAGLSGALPRAEGDFLAVVPNNAAANKADYFMRWAVKYEVWLEDGGDARAQVTVEGHNGTPQEGSRRYIIGPNVNYLDAGDNLTYLSVLCAPGCEQSYAKQNDAQQFWRGVEADRELGFRTLSSWHWAPSGGTTDMQYTLQLADVWSGADAEGGDYTLRLQTPPLAQPADVRVVIHPPHPLQIGDASEPLTIESGQAVWSGKLAVPREFDVTLVRTPRDAFAYRLNDYADRVQEFWGRRL